MNHSQGLLVFVGLMESMKAVDSLNPEQFADLASSLNNFFTKINNEQQQQQVPYSSVESNPSSSTTTSEWNYIFSYSFCKQFADLASSLNNFFTKINNEQQQQTGAHIPPWRVIRPVSTTNKWVKLHFQLFFLQENPTKYDVCNFRRLFGGAFMCNTGLKVPFKYFLVFPKSERGDLGQSAGSGK